MFKISNLFESFKTKLARNAILLTVLIGQEINQRT